MAKRGKSPIRATIAMKIGVSEPLLVLANNTQRHYQWEGFSEPLDCPSDEICKPESMRGTLAIYGGEEVR